MIEPITQEFQFGFTELTFIGIDAEWKILQALEYDSKMIFMLLVWRESDENVIYIG